ncbi:hypothetical protein JK358_16530 [Nocardia sp. 2]|uniref:Uncharacterized protein n=1 Tax=Nocardia acididurans TaxID=2802282 RepID=A0ABS1M7K2_9NOCA|nr:hypothetical protein [Nocardia acididurans]MBL1076005.1 hypothetical protein [Nocardia acididurans]
MIPRPRRSGPYGITEGDAPVRLRDGVGSMRESGVERDRCDARITAIGGGAREVLSG